GEGASGFMARDVSAASDFHAFRENRCRPLDLELEVEYTARPTHIEVSGHLIDTRGEDRAVTLVFALPLDLEGWTWGDDIRRGRRIAGSAEYIQATGVRCGATGTMSLYPLAPVFDETSGLALAIDMDRPAVHRLSYHAGTGQLAVGFDVALVAETRRFPRRAPLRFIIYRFDPRWGFRAAFEKLQEIYPSYFEVRSRRQGIWMPFTDVSTVQGWRDFGFRYHEGTNNVPFDDDSDILSFHYTEPMTWWMRMQSSSPRTPDAARSQRDKLAAGGEGQPSRMARVAQTCGMEDEAGEPCLLFRDTPWCDGAVWSINPNPHLPGESNGATVHWSEEIRNRRYGPQAKGALDGEYLDSLEGYVTAELNLRREHFIHSTVPLTFSRVSHRPALFKGLAIHEFTRWISADVHAMGKLLFANGVPYRFPFLCPWLDVMGTETNWLRGGRLAPPSDAQLCLWRTMAGAKPYLLLMNTDYNALGPELVEEYFLISLFHGFYPSMFSHNASEDPYWKNPRWYDRDRHLFVKYQPLIRRVAEAGWRPVTHARCTDPDILVERFGPDEKGCSFFTLRNPTGETRGGRLVIDPRALSISAEQRVESLEARELIRGLELEDEAWRVAVRLGPGEVWAIQACPRR
ncbi:MAG: hypothetical protein JXA90_01235, partial [Planctomycetes bacterium]|nr:hypothetical protein [Planctomycetota bacterium]